LRRVVVEGWTLTEVRPGWWDIVSPEGDRCLRGGFRQMVFRALGRLPLTSEMPG